MKQDWLLHRFIRYKFVSYGKQRLPHSSGDVPHSNGRIVGLRLAHTPLKIESNRFLYLLKKLINIQQSLCPIRCSGFVTRKAFYTT